MDSIAGFIFVFNVKVSRVNDSEFSTLAMITLPSSVSTDEVGWQAVGHSPSQVPA